MTAFTADICESVSFDTIANQIASDSRSFQNKFL